MSGWTMGIPGNPPNGVPAASVVESFAKNVRNESVAIVSCWVNPKRNESDDCATESLCSKKGMVSETIVVSLGFSITSEF